jgi:hypothetical protein
MVSNNRLYFELKKYMYGTPQASLKFFQFMIRARIAAATGKFDNHVMWNGVANVAAFTQDPNANHVLPVQAPRSAKSGRQVTSLQSAFTAMDKWLTAVANDKSADTQAIKVVKNKPPTLVDGCFGATTPGAADDFIAEPQLFGGFNTVFVKGNGSVSPAGLVGTGTTPTRCNAMLPASSYPRFEAGEPLTGRTMQCNVKPVSAADYAGYTALNSTWTSAAQEKDLASLRAVFTTGVCDYTNQVCRNSPSAGLGRKSRVSVK